MCIDNFNEITRLNEKLRGSVREERHMNCFRECLDFCGLKDLGYSGLSYTWCNRRFDGVVVWVRSDRALATPDWMLKFPSVRLHHLPGFSSNHKLIWLCSDDVQSRFFRPQRPFRFEATWLKYERCEEVVNEAWDMDSIGYPMGKVLLKVNNCQNLLSTWNRKLFGNVCSMLIKKRKELEQVEWLPISGGNQNRLKLLNEEIQKLVEMEECLWQQRAKEDWLRDGDQNSKYFHCKSTERNKRYFISGLGNEHGESIEEENQIGALLTAYYTKLFMSSNPTNFDRVLEEVDQKV